MHIWISILTGFEATVCFAAFVWAVKGHFRSTGKTPAGMKLISVLSAVLFAAFLWHLRHGASSFWPLALMLFTASLMLFFAAIRTSRSTPPTLAYDTDSPKFLLSHGAYRYVRHPFYLAYVLFWFGTAIAVHSLTAWAAPVIMTILYIDAAAREERKFADSDLADAYAAYRTRAGLFWPHIPG